MRKWLTVPVVALALAGCGGDEPSSDDQATIKAVLTSGAAVQRALQPLMVCVEPACYRKAGPELVRVVGEQQRRFAPILAETDNECLREVATLYDNSLDAYAEVGRAAERGDMSASDSALSRSTEIEISYSRKLADCGVSEGRSAEFSAAMRQVNIDLLRLGEEIYSCTTQRCIRSVASEIEAKAREAVTAVDEFRSETGQDMPLCFQKAFATMRGGFLMLEKASAALQANDYAVAQEAGERASALQADALDEMARCVETLGG